MYSFILLAVLASSALAAPYPDNSIDKRKLPPGCSVVDGISVVCPTSGTILFPFPSGGFPAATAKNHHPSPTLEFRAEFQPVENDVRPRELSPGCIAVTRGSVANAALSGPSIPSIVESEVARNP